MEDLEQWGFSSFLPPLLSLGASWQTLPLSPYLFAADKQNSQKIQFLPWIQKLAIFINLRSSYLSSKFERLQWSNLNLLLLRFSASHCSRRVQALPHTHTQKNIKWTSIVTTRKLYWHIYTIQDAYISSASPPSIWHPTQNTETSPPDQTSQNVKIS